MPSKSTKGAELVAFLRDYAGSRINSRLFDARRCIPPYVVLDFAREGLLGLEVPPALGGLGISWRERVAIVQQLGAIDLTITLFVGIHNDLGINPILYFGNPKLQEQLLPQMASGSVLGGLAVSEDAAGANARGIKATAEPLAGGGWRLNGEKILVGNGSWAGVLNVVARSNEGRASRVLGFAVSTQTPGVCMGPEAMTVGMRGVVQSRIKLSNVEIGPERLLGLSTTDMLVAETSFRLARLGVASMAAGAIKRCVQLMMRYGTRRQIATGPISEHPVFRAVLGDAYAATKILDRLTLLIADSMDAKREIPAELYFVCKALAPEYLFAAADGLVQWLGNRGYLEANEAPQILRDARGLRIFEGPTETMRGHLGSMWRNQDGLRTFMSRSSEVIAGQLAAAAEELWDTPRHPSMSIGQYTYARHAAIGEVVADAVAWWIADTQSTDEGTIEWARRRFEAARRRGAFFISRALLDISRIPSEMSDSIGDVFQTLPGEEWSMDPLLQP